MSIMESYLKMKDPTHIMKFEFSEDLFGPAEVKNPGIERFSSAEKIGEMLKETIKKDLPKGFQTAEFVLEHGFLDFIVDRRAMKAKLAAFLKMMKN